MISGPLVTLADGTWYLEGASHRLLAVDANDVRAADIAASHRKRDDPVNEDLIHIIFG